MELRHLRYFVTVAEELHFARAALRLNIAAPTLTVQIQEIERTLSAKLFTRTKRSVALTPAGHAFLPEARAALAQFAKAETVGRSAGRGELGRIEIGYVASAAYSGVLQDQIGLFRRRWPQVHVNAFELGMNDLPQDVSDGKIDIGFVRLPLPLSNGLGSHVLVEDVFCLASPAQDARGTDVVSPKDLVQVDLILPEQSAGTYEVATRGGFTPRIVSVPGSLLAVLTQVSIGVGSAVVPSSVENILRLPGVDFNRLAGDPIRSQVAAIFRLDGASPSVLNMIEQIRETKPKSFVL